MQRGAGGTPGGLTEFFIGTAMLLIGSYLFAQRLMVSSNIQTFWGAGGTGIALLLLVVGIGVLFFSGKSVLGWLLVGIGGLMILVGVVTNLVVYFMPTSLFQTVVMLGLIAGGLGLIARALRPH